MDADLLPARRLRAYMVDAYALGPIAGKRSKSFRSLQFKQMLGQCSGEVRRIKLKTDYHGPY